MVPESGDLPSFENVAGPGDLEAPQDINFPYGLTEDEYTWVTWQPFLETSAGYRLRDRYHLGWVGSWVASGADPTTCPDSKSSEIADVAMDAVRISDGLQVMLKLMRHTEAGEHRCNIREKAILEYLNDENLRPDPRNHCVHLIEYFDGMLPDGSVHPQIGFLVLPRLYIWQRPIFLLNTEALCFTAQLLEGLEFMHVYGVAHGDILKRNIMMDAHPVDPSDRWGWYFLTHAPEGAQIDDEERFVRAQGPVKYYYIDFDLATVCLDDTPVFPLPNNRTLDDVPEVVEEGSVPFDPFKADVYLLGCLFRDTFFTGYIRSRIPYVEPLVQQMLIPDPAQRPSIFDCCNLFRSLTHNAFKLKLYAPVRCIESRTFFWLVFFPLCLRAAARTLRHGRQELFSHVMIHDEDRHSTASGVT